MRDEVMQAVFITAAARIGDRWAALTAEAADSMEEADMAAATTKQHTYRCVKFNRQDAYCLDRQPDNGKPLSDLLGCFELF